ncbi:MAG: serine/threonine protein kinase [Myxococcales bacterium]|nr:serine/threonine protein kinase [Myxococcales bacterium]
MTDRRDDDGGAAEVAADAGRADTVASDADPSPSSGTPTGRASAAIAAGPGTQLGRYLLGDELGAGGMATVFRARDVELRRDVAVKVLFPHLARKPELTRRFQREARAAAGLEHANILRVYDVGTDGTAYIVMELVRGQSLRERAEADGPLLAELVAAIGALLCDALAVAHAAGVVHRDVKPANVMIADDGRLLLTDFGVARLDDDDSLVTRTGALLGTPSFMAPEQAHGPVDARADLYSVGVTLYQLVTGSLPFAGSTVKILAEAQKGAVPALRRAPAVGAPLSRLIAQLMDPDPSLRPADATIAAAALRRLVTDGGLGEPRDEVRAFAADRAGFRAARLPAVLAALTATAEAAAARGATATALATCDRLLALAPEHAAATALLARLTRRDQRRRLVIGGGVAALVVAGAGGGWLALGGRGHAPAAPAAALIDAGLIDAGRIDAAVEAAPIEAGPTDAAPIDAPTDAAPRRDAAAQLGAIPTDAAPRRDAAAQLGSVPTDAARVDAAPIDAAPRDAPALAIDAAPAPAMLTLVFDTWCDLTVDGKPRGRASRQPIALAPGRHQLACKQGLGQGAWSQDLVVGAGEVRTVEGTLLAPVVVENGLAESVRLQDHTLARGATATLRPGRVRVEIVRAGQPAALGWVTLPRVPRCTLRTSPELDCYP